MNSIPKYFLSLFVFIIFPGSDPEKKKTGTEPDNPAPITVTNDYCRTDNNTFSDNETLTYKIYYNVNFIWIGAGTVTFNIDKRGSNYFAEAVGKTYGGYDWIFKVRDTFQSVLDQNTLLPIESTRVVNEGNYTKYDHVQYMRNSRLARSAMGKSRLNAETKIITVDQCVHDVLSTLYAFRNTSVQSLANDKRYSLDMLLDRKKYPVSMKFGGEEKKKIKGIGPLDSYLIEPKVVVGNIFSEEDGMKIWVSKDQNKVPLLIESPIAVGKIKAVLSGHKGLKYPTNGY
ncbi:DUF3108 domain-containing protein [Membranihabitans maritimus]|uniref:DUF3108 domain-containing protein n=1 Tax=Membranihabitans maritimus TaxID=2904244 RepID=UPI001F20E89B|nr:DUF3108 domain-containing protein [Membranihabitans maritimus]